MMPLARTVMPINVMMLAVHFTYQVISYFGVTELTLLTTSYDGLFFFWIPILRDPFHVALFQFLQAYMLPHAVCILQLYAFFLYRATLSKKLFLLLCENTRRNIHVGCLVCRSLYRDWSKFKLLFDCKLVDIIIIYQPSKPTHHAHKHEQ